MTSDVALSCPWSNRYAVASSSTPEITYVAVIIGLRPIVSNSRLSKIAPRKLPAANGIR